MRSFPLGTPLAVVAPRACGFGEILAERGDGATAFIELAVDALPEHPSFASAENVLLEGLDAMREPAELLLRLGRISGSARLFAIVANASYARSLDAFYRGANLAVEHPLTREELPQLLADGGWKTVAINPVFDKLLPASVPATIQLPAVQFSCEDGAVLERLRVQAFLAIADRV